MTTPKQSFAERIFEFEWPWSGFCPECLGFGPSHHWNWMGGDKEEASIGHNPGCEAGEFLTNAGLPVLWKGEAKIPMTEQGERNKERDNRFMKKWGEHLLPILFEGLEKKGPA